ncbi:MAG: hypothetical protein RLZZ480_815 [Candidatus Parcubacteria bacterium]|jgi:hypothetical protein
MKKIVLAVLSVATLGLSAGAANAAVVNLSAVGSASVNDQLAPVTQAAAAGSGAGGVVDDSVIDNSATNVNNLVSNTTDVTQNGGFLNGSLVTQGQLNFSAAPVSQSSIAAHLGGAILDSDVSNAAANINNAALNTTVVVQR